MIKPVEEVSKSSKDCSLPIDLPVPASFLANLAQNTVIFQVGLFSRASGVM